MSEEDRVVWEKALEEASKINELTYSIVLGQAQKAGYVLPSAGAGISKAASYRKARIRAVIERLHDEY
jgi:hypothetical protein